jgi:hypothetical protein
MVSPYERMVEDEETLVARLEVCSDSFVEVARVLG